MGGVQHGAPHPNPSMLEWMSHSELPPLGASLPQHLPYSEDLFSALHCLHKIGAGKRIQWVECLSSIPKSWVQSP